MGCGCSKVSPAPATASVSVPSNAPQAKSTPPTSKAAPQSAPQAKAAAPQGSGANGMGGHSAPPPAAAASARASAVDIESSSMSLSEPGGGIHPVSTRASVQMPNPAAERVPKPFEEKELEEKLLKLQRMREEEEQREVPEEGQEVQPVGQKVQPVGQEVQPVGQEVQEEVHEIQEVQEELHDGHDSDGEKAKVAQVVQEEKKPKAESSAKKKGKILLQVQLKNNNEFMEMKVKPGQVYFEDLPRWSESFWGASNLAFSVVENDEIVQINSEEQFQDIVQRHGLVDEPFVVYAQPKKIQETIAEGDEEEALIEPTQPANDNEPPAQETLPARPDSKLFDAADLKLEKETHVHFRFVNEDETEMFSNVSNDTSFWQVTSIIRTAYGFPVCFRTSHFAEPLTTIEQYQHILSEYKNNDEKYITLYTERIDDLDLETVDDFELVYEEKKENVFIKCTIGDGEPISCIFPIPFSLDDLYRRFHGVDDGVMSMSASFAHVRDVQIHDDGQLQELIRSYQHTLHKYFNISISHTRHIVFILSRVISIPIDEDTEADILEDKTKQLHLICHLDNVPLDMVCPSGMSYEDFNTQLGSLVNGLYSVTTNEDNESARIHVNSAQVFQTVIADFSKSAQKHLHLLIKRVEEAA